MRQTPDLPMIAMRVQSPQMNVNEFKVPVICGGTVLGIVPDYPALSIRNSAPRHRSLSGLLPRVPSVAVLVGSQERELIPEETNRVKGRAGGDKRLPLARSGEPPAYFPMLVAAAIDLVGETGLSARTNALNIAGNARRLSHPVV